ncbi:hypothetical protein ACQX0N_11345 [Clostridium tepidum]|uniref:Peptidase MA-like domain-containing protein n=1 Tax=Clostridium tepidum TaxID=1962263 RepID=A0A1S9IHR5_9CLOT|nr:hypothetical protein [Clostridium tepidum]MCR1934569.1 hypothetical protein [Clostridium tepidum]MDU6877602.1 hypothetical protein [Clostridium botulinum]OOO62552.1 hypothetical protein BS637_06870 [Clostridium tepidum]OOO69830.1 hypothetical protein BS638_00115 [Clostridium tepidum]
MTNIKLNIKDFRILRDIEDLYGFYNKVINIKNIFKFKNEVTIDVVDSLEELSDIVGISVPDWVIGISLPDSILILDHEKWKQSNNEKVENLILHEFIHVILNSKAQSILPIWLNEGLAVYFSGQYENYKDKKPNINKNFNFYNMDYSDGRLYHISIYIIMKLIEKYSIKRIVNETLKTKNFEQSKIFSNKNLLELL